MIQLAEFLSKIRKEKGSGIEVACIYKGKIYELSDTLEYSRIPEKLRRKCIDCFNICPMKFDLGIINRITIYLKDLDQYE